ncbi:hypothetical protein DY000_02037909 [Brassica cretica]|uniref:Protein kinase domain-containing protein n=1 Tax=Brassica cretica TaxID=69181 RepID=A0ABQ7BGQ1_BRACR|nr:hypothetical protein DY000_02037909 [Brassica cretica]
MDNDGYFRPNGNGTYDRNRRLILSSFPSNISTQEGLFYNGSIGQEPNRVYAIFPLGIVITVCGRAQGTTSHAVVRSKEALLCGQAAFSGGTCIHTAFDKFTVASPPPPPPAEDDQARTTNNDSKGISSGVVVAMPVPTVVTIFILLVVGFVLCRRKKSMQRCKESKLNVTDSDILTPQSSQYDFKTIEAATNKFSRSNKLGEGGFDEVMPSNGIEVAVKQLSKNAGKGIREFKKEAVLVSKLQHQEFDFGLSTIFAMEQTRGNTRRIAGTYGYMSPEYAMQGQYSMKSDIYSFGVLLIEIISGKKNGGVYLMDETSTDGNLITMLGGFGKWITARSEVTRCIHIALLCVQDNPINVHCYQLSS